MLEFCAVLMLVPFKKEVTPRPDMCSTLPTKITTTDYRLQSFDAFSSNLIEIVSIHYMLIR